ncbi:NAD(P)-dependent oxidoreductase [Gordonia sp. ABSL1-1]|uniref:NAD(P)-dependent oxidoreductase n=1 Tax=Gordonia sp. ABSL1-1 TaxID=3053923 RepID=UPI0025724691|nr:NAD(P)-dependent oxidoreductase [Gordonia sp. ABSL1-1]MDL9938087.1 NAD(P)-dependent oxidoreductase [Gordonia sp. ABSL1-1]
MNQPRIGFVGTGNIGEPMVERLLGAGHPTSVFARRTEVRNRLAARGAVLVDSAAGIAEGADIVISCVFSDEQLMDVAPGIIEVMAPGSVFCSHTTGSPRNVERLAEIAAPREVAIVDAPFSGTPEIIRRGELTVLLGGTDPAADTARKAVSAYASRIHRIGALGTALSAKLVNNALFAAFTQITLSALQAGEELGISETALLAVLDDSSGGSTAARYIANSGQDAATYSARITRYLTKDLSSARAAAADIGADLDDLLAASRLGPMDLDEPAAAR